MWTAVSGAAARTAQLESTANNLANADTLGYKRDSVTFKEYLASAERPPEGKEPPHGLIKDQAFYPTDGKDQSMVAVSGTYTDFNPGGMRVTQLPLDLAIDGKGTFEIATPNGIRYTRHGGFKVGPDGRLVTTQGYPVLSARAGGLPPDPAAIEAARATGGPIPGSPNDPNIQSRFISLRDRNGALSITESGEIFSGQDQIGQLSVVEFADPRKLRKTGQQLFENPDPANILKDPSKSLVKQGMLETSNVNPVREMSDLINSQRLLEEDMKAMKTYSDLLGREANDIGKL